MLLMTVFFQNQSMKIDFNVCDGPRMGSLAMGYWTKLFGERVVFKST